MHAANVSCLMIAPDVPSIPNAIDLLALPARPATGTKQTARIAAQILVQDGIGFREPSGTERRALAVGFAMAGKILYGAAFDLVRTDVEVDLSDPASIFAAISSITVFEVKSTNKPSVREDFGGYFFDLTTAELLVAQSLGTQYRFAFVNTITRKHVELSLTQLFAKARKIYPKWAVTF